MANTTDKYVVYVDRSFLASCRAGSAALIREAEALRCHPDATQTTLERADAIYRNATMLRQFADDALKSLVLC